jgi:RNA polymerase sigma-70 factor, ECF subfamily
VKVTSRKAPLNIEPLPQGMVFADVYAAHFHFVWRCLQGLGVPREQLDDAVQETFMVVHRRMSELTSELAIRPWIYGILRYVVNNQRRGVVRRLRANARLEVEPIAPQAGPFEALQANQARQLLLNFLLTLEVKRREVFYLVDVEDVPIPEVASTLRIPLNTAYSRLRRAREDFTAWLSACGVSL